MHLNLKLHHKMTRARCKIAEYLQYRPIDRERVKAWHIYNSLLHMLVLLILYIMHHHLDYNKSTFQSELPNPTKI